MAKASAPVPAMAAAVAQAMTGPALPCPVVPVVRAATRSSAAMPVALPSWAAGP